MNRPLQAPINAMPACKDHVFDHEQPSNRALQLNRSRSLDTSPTPALSFAEKRSVSFSSEVNVNHAEDEQPSGLAAISPTEQPLRQSNSVGQCTPQGKGDVISSRRQMSGVSMQTAVHHPLEMPTNGTPAYQDYHCNDDQPSKSRVLHNNQRSSSSDLSPRPSFPFEKRSISPSPEVDVNEHPLHRSSSGEQYTPQEKGETTPMRTTFLNAIVNLKLMLAESASEADSAKSLCIRLSRCNAELRDMSNTTALLNEELREENKQINHELAMQTRRNTQLEEENAALKREADQVQLERNSFKSRLKLMTTESFSPEETNASRKLSTQSFFGLAKNLLWDDLTSEDAPKVQSSIDVKKQVACRAA